MVSILVPITQKWRDELKKLTEAAKQKSNNSYTNVTAYQLPPCSRQGEKPPQSRGGELPPPSRQGSQHGERVQTRLGTRDGNRPPPIPEQQQYQHIAPYPDNENQVTYINYILRIPCGRSRGGALGAHKPPLVTKNILLLKKKKTSTTYKQI